MDVVIDFHGAELEQTHTEEWEPLISDLFLGDPTYPKDRP